MVNALHKQKYGESVDDACNDFDSYAVDGSLWFRSGFVVVLVFGLCGWYLSGLVLTFALHSGQVFMNGMSYVMGPSVWLQNFFDMDFTGAITCSDNFAEC